MLKSDDGKRVASKPEWIVQFLALRIVHVLPLLSSKSSARRLKACCLSAQKAITDDEIVIACDKLLIAKVDELQRSALQSQRDIDETLTGLRTLAKLSEAATPAEPSPLKLSLQRRTPDGRKTV